jgi:hypothetical protein
VIVELCGVPGAGKSFLAGELAAELRRRGRPVTLVLEPVGPSRPRLERVLRKTARAAVELLGHPVRSVGAVGCIAGSRQASLRDVVARSLNWLVLQHGMRRARRLGGVHIADQGLVQELGSIGLRGDPIAMLARADPGVGRLGPDHVVVLDVASALADRRLRDRDGKQSRLEQRGDGAGALERFGRLVEAQLAGWMVRFGEQVPTTMQRVRNNEDGLRPTIAELADVLLPPCQSTDNARVRTHG